MNKINFENLPSTNTPLSAENLNQLQTNIDNAKIEKTAIVNERSTSTEEIYSCNYVNKLNVYSGDEVRIGTWMDKPLYRKVITRQIGTGIENGEFLYYGENIDIKNFYGRISYSGGWHIIGAYANANFYSLLQWNTGNNRLLIYGKGYSNSNCEVVMEYTKTTD